MAGNGTSAKVGPLPRLSLQQAFASLKYRNYRLWFMGQLASLVGTWMQTTAQGFLVYQLTSSAAFLGYVGFASGVATWLFTLYGGVISDRMSRRTLMIITQTAMMILAFALAALTFARLIQPWHIIVLAFLLGVANAFDAPARQSFVLEMVPREDMTNAIALNSTMFNSATAVGPAVAGLTYAVLGPAWCFTINAFSFIAVIVALALMDIEPHPRRAQATSALAELAEGLRYVRSHSAIRTLILTASVTSLFGLGFATLLPAWAVEVLHGGPDTNGFLQSARGIGSLVGALMIASLGRFHFKGKLLTLGSLVFPILLLVFAAVSWLPLALLVLVGVGWGFMVMLNMANALVQTLVSDELRGRVMAVYSLGFLGMMPVGALLAGGVAEITSEPIAAAWGALITLGFSVWLCVSGKVRTLE
jgi:MFS family permease